MSSKRPDFYLVLLCFIIYVIQFINPLTLGASIIILFIITAIYRYSGLLQKSNNSLVNSHLIYQERTSLVSFAMLLFSFIVGLTGLKSLAFFLLIGVLYIYFRVICGFYFLITGAEIG